MRIISNNLITKLAEGGTPPFVSFSNITAPAPTYDLPNIQLGATQNNEILDKNMVKFLYENGIPSDVEEFIDNSGIFSSSLLSNPFDKNNSILRYRSILKILPKIRAEHDRFKKAMDVANDNGGLGEIAVTDKGFVLTVDENNNLSKKTLDTVDLNKERLLTNYDLANYRLNNKSAAFNTDLTSIIQNAIGIPKITEYIQSVISKLGTTSMSSQGYVGKRSGEYLKGIEYLSELNPSAAELKGMSLDGLYKVSNIEKSQQIQANQALNYLLSNLPNNMRVVLQSKAATNLGDNSLEGVKKILTQIVGSVMKGESTFNIDFQENLDAKGNKRTTSSSKDDNIIDSPKAFLLGYGEVKPQRINYGTSKSLMLLGNSAPLTETSGKPIGQATLSLVVNQGNFNGVLDFKNATMGGSPINFQQRDRVVVDGSNVVSVDLPLDIEAAEQGIIKPDISSLKRLEMAEEQIREGNITDQDEINKIYEAYKLPYKYVNGQINTSAYGRFAVLNSVAVGSAFLEDPDLDDSLIALEDINEREGIERIIKSADKSFKMSLPGWGGLSSGDPVYSGSLYIPVRSNMINTAIGSGHYPTVLGNDAHFIDAQEQRKARDEYARQAYKPTPSLSTYK